MIVYRFNIWRCLDEKSLRFIQVVVGVVDPNPLVGGQGIQTLRDNGIQVDVGCIEDECFSLNKDFMLRMSCKD